MKAQRKAALVAGIGLVAMAVAAGFAFGYVDNNIFSEGDPAAKLSRLQASQSLFLAGIAAWVLVVVLDILVAGALYLYFCRAFQGISGLAAAVRIVYAGILGVAVGQQFKVYALLPEVDQQLSTQMGDRIMTHMEQFHQTWSAGLILFGVHLLLLGYMAWRADFVHRIWGALLGIAGLSYMVVNALKAMDAVSASESLEMVLSFPMVVGEMGFAIWLLVRGKRKADF